jgi:CubicO group peptidase (beta-lactamase class C family)
MPSVDPAKADMVMKVVKDTMAKAHLKAVIVRVTIDGKKIVTQAVGDSMPGVPTTTEMHFRNGAVAISYVSTLLLQLVDEKKVSLDDKVSKWLPDIPYTDKVTLGHSDEDTSRSGSAPLRSTTMSSTSRWPLSPDHPQRPASTTAL